VEGLAGRAWVPTDGSCLVGPGVVHRLEPIEEDHGALERLYVHPETARIVFPERWRETAARAPALVSAEFFRDGSAALEHPAFGTASAPAVPAIRPPHPGLARAVHHLENNLHRTVSLDELSGACGLSKFHLCRMFHRIVGVTPRTYHRHIRLERGRALLHAGRPAAKIAEALSFSDQSHFIRTFRRQFGMTPGDFLAARAPAHLAAPHAACA